MGQEQPSKVDLLPLGAFWIFAASKHDLEGDSGRRNQCVEGGFWRNRTKPRRECHHTYPKARCMLYLLPLGAFWIFATSKSDFEGDSGSKKK